MTYNGGYDQTPWSINESPIERMIRVAAKAEDQRIRDALIGLGWTPPDMLGAHDDAVAKAAVLDYRTHNAVVVAFDPASHELIERDRKIAVRTLRETARKASLLGRVSGSGVDVGARAARFLEVQADNLERGVIE